MNKDVIYIEPEDDITNIIDRLKSSKQKVVALVPPKKPGALRSSINIKLVAKIAKESEKAVVIVTADQALSKIASNAGLPVAETLQSRPVLPSEVEAKSLPKQSDDIIDETEETESSNAKPTSKLDESVKPESKSEPDLQINSTDLEPEKDSSKKSTTKKVPNFDKYRKWIVLGAIGIILVTGFSIWAFIFAPAVKVSVSIKTSSSNFSENVTFTDKAGSESNKEGKFLLEKYQISKESSIEFTATGKKDIGEKAKGELVAYAYFRSSGSYSIPAGSNFKYGNLSYASITEARLSWDSSDPSVCENASSSSAFTTGCLRSVRVKIVASKSGEDHNLDPKNNGWSSSIQGVYVYNDATISGGTTKNITIVQQSDIDKAKEQLTSNLEESKNELISKAGSDAIIIDPSFKTVNKDPVPTPAVGEEVSDKKPTLKITTEYIIYGVDKTAVEDYIKSTTEAKLVEDQKYYSSSSPFFERFTEGNPTTAKLKAITHSGPKVTESDILEKSKGKKIGEVQSQLKSINGVSGVFIDTSYFWVYSIPNDVNKISIDLKIVE